MHQGVFSCLKSIYDGRQIKADTPRCFNLVHKQLAPYGTLNIFSLSNELEMSMSLAPSLFQRTKLGGTIRVMVGDSNPRYLAELNGSRVYCDDYATAQAHLDYWSKQQLHCWGRS